MRPTLRRLLPFLMVTALLSGALLGSRYLDPGHEIPEGLLFASGRIEGDTITVASKLAGRVATVHGREGEQVRGGQELVRLDEPAARARVAQASAAVQAASAQVEATWARLQVLRDEVPCQIGAARAQVLAAQARFAEAQKAEEQARRDALRFRRLAEKGTVDAQTAERADLSWRQSTDRREAAQAELTQSRQNLSEASLGPERIRALEAEFDAREAAEKEAQGRLAEYRSLLEDLTIRSPSDGTLTERLVEPGEVVSAGSPLFELVDLDRLYLKVYVPEVEIGKLRRGLPARIYTDAFPDLPFRAEVRYISARAEFTPKEVQTRDERVKLVYAVKLYLQDNPEHRLTPGLPADAIIRWKEGVEWQSPPQ